MHRKRPAKYRIFDLKKDIFCNRLAFLQLQGLSHKFFWSE